MDEDRKIRFLVAPVLFFVSMAWAIVCDPSHTFSAFVSVLPTKIANMSQLIAILTGGGVAVFAVGVVIGTLSYALLRIAFWIKAWLVDKAWHPEISHEASFDSETLKALWKRIDTREPPDSLQALYIGVTFDFDVLRKKHEGVHRWIFRRWNAFSIAVTSIVAILLSLVVSVSLGLALTKWWWIPIIVAGSSFVFVAVMAWQDAMGMVRFQARRIPPEEKDSK